MKLEKGLLLYITPFYYQDGKTEPQNKFFLCLKNNNSGTVVSSLPTSRDKIPSYHKVQHGCNDIDKAQQCSYCFIAGKIVTDKGFSFEKTPIFLVMKLYISKNHYFLISIRKKGLTIT